MELKEIRTPHFYLEEMIKSNTAERLAIPNVPSVGVLRNICELITEVLEPARVKLGAAITITSGYRCVELNKLVSKTQNSQHIRGQAADLQCFTNGKQDLKKMRALFDILKQMDIDQLLWEKDAKGTQWIHVSFAGHGVNRQYVNNNYKA